MATATRTEQKIKNCGSQLHLMPMRAFRKDAERLAKEGWQVENQSATRRINSTTYVVTYRRMVSQDGKWFWDGGQWQPLKP